MKTQDAFIVSKIKIENFKMLFWWNHKVEWNLYHFAKPRKNMINAN